MSDALKRALATMSRQEKEELLADLTEKENRLELKAARTDPVAFAKRIYPGFKVGPQHRKLGKIFQDVLAGRKKRVIINIAPRMGKSEFSSYLFPAFFLGEFPEKKILMATHTAGLSESFGRRVRNLIESEEYREIFPDTLIADDQKAAGNWSTSEGGQYYAAGVGGALAGRGADLFVIDDPHSEQDAKSNSRLAFDTAWSWFQTGPLQRLMPGGAIIIIMCMTGDTPVLMGDGQEKPLRDVQVGDVVATFDKGRLTTSRVLNHRSNGVDSIYQIQTQSGKILRANERHPFLVMNEGVLEWTRLKNLKPGMLLVATKGAVDPQGHRQNPDFAQRACREIPTIGKIQMHPEGNLASTGSGKGSGALLRGVQSWLKLKEFVFPTTTSSAGQKEPLTHPQRNAAQGASSTGMASPLSSMMQWCTRAAASVMYVVGNLMTRTRVLTGMANSASTITMTQEQFEDFCATIAILRLDMAKRQTYSSELQRISDFTVDPIVSISPAGEEEVFDVQVERTENFIANGVVSHNTRWSLLDLTGRLIDFQTRNPDTEPWEIVELPAILESKNEETGTTIEKSLWPEQWPLEQLQATRAALDPRYWNAQYMQQPTSDMAATIKRSDWMVWEPEDPPKCEYVIQSWDTAYETKTNSDYSACTTWGIWYDEERKNRPSLILLDAFKGRLTFPELKVEALKAYKEWKPDAFIIEKKAAGAPLIQELRAIGIPVQEFSPSRGNDKLVRLHAVSDLFATGIVWAPDRRWAREVIEEVAAFPVGEHDDYVDTVTQALLRYRQGGFIPLDSDEQDDQFFRARKAAYY